MERWSPAWLAREGLRFLDAPGARRDALVGALTNPANEYSRQRLASYGLETRGWDLLPAWIPRTLPVDRAVADSMRAGREPEIPAGVAPLWDGRRPASAPEWIALGRRVFLEYPLRAEVYAEQGLREPALLDASGVRPAPDGSYPGLRVFLDVDGRARVGITCALCHSAVLDGALVEGAARREFDYGTLRLRAHASSRAYLDPGLAARMARWGAGRADVTGDESEDPVAIPDLWGLRDQQYLTQAGTIRHVGPAALAIRQETQLLHSNHERVRPPRELAWALAMYLYSLQAPPRPAGDAALVARGGRLFDEQCRECHGNAAGGGPLVTAARVGTNAALAMGHGRGTGRYRPPALIAVGGAGPYLHDGSVATLEELFSRERLSPTYRGVHGVGAVMGHLWGTELTTDDRAALLAWLRAR